MSPFKSPETARVGFFPLQNKKGCTQPVGSSLPTCCVTLNNPSLSLSILKMGNKSSHHLIFLVKWSGW